ncbi:MAG: toll/interleukin-1 receptor domain-containing protein [Magnetococcales bacterium]|nr:toll/interleukin-1 receptor domain-containing protein [Magnetococcales bacterium]
MSDVKAYKFDAFLSYSHEDRDAVRTLASQPRQDDLRVWLDEQAIAPASPIRQSIVDGLAHSRVAILTLSQHSMSSEWAKMERDLVISRDPNNSKKRFIPLRLDDCAIPDDLNMYSIVDYRNKDISEYEKLLNFCSPDVPQHPTDDPTNNLVDLLPFINMTKENKELKAALLNMKIASKTGPLLCILAGDDDDEHRYFLSRFVNETYPLVINKADDTRYKYCEIDIGYSTINKQIFWKSIIKNGFEGYKNRYRKHIFNSLRKEDINVNNSESFCQSINNNPDCILFSCHFHLDNFKSDDEKSIQTWLNIWQEIANKLNKIVIIALCLHKKTQKNKSDLAQKIIDKICNGFSNSDPVILNPLSKISFDDVKFWLEHYVRPRINCSSTIYMERFFWKKMNDNKIPIRNFIYDPGLEFISFVSNKIEGEDENQSLLYRNNQ